MTDEKNTEASTEAKTIDAQEAEATPSTETTTEVEIRTEPINDTPVNNIEDSDLANYVEAMIFSSASPLPSTKISQALNCGGVSRIKNAIASLNEAYEATGRAFRIRQVAGGYQYYVLPQWSDCLKKLFTKTRKIRLTKAALETMAVVAYNQPVSKNQIEFIRGVAADGVIHNLLEKNLIRISGRSEGAGRSLLYSATDEFLRFFGLNSFDDLPRIAEIEELIQQMEVERADKVTSAISDEAETEVEIDDLETAVTDSDEATTTLTEDDIASDSEADTEEDDVDTPDADTDPTVIDDISDSVDEEIEDQAKETPITSQS